MDRTGTAARRAGLDAPRRNRYFHGKMMDVYHFELEAAYGIGMRRLLNRLVVGDGVVCGLDVVPGTDDGTVVVTSGVALDGWGREVVVPSRTAPIPVPPDLVDQVLGRPDDEGYGAPGPQQGYGSPGGGTGEAGTAPAYRDAGEQAEERGYRKRGDRDEDDGWVTALLCYHECETEPVAVLAGDCDTADPCAPGAIREQYRVGFEPGRLGPFEWSCRFPEVLSGGQLDYAALAKWVSRECPAPRRDPCVPLANVRLERRGDDVVVDDVDITIRPVVLANELLADILARIVESHRDDEYRR